MKKIISVVLAIAMLFALAVPAFAAVNEAGKGVVGENEYNVYIAGRVLKIASSTVVITLIKGDDEIGHVAEVKTDADGYYEHKFKFRGDIENYQLLVRDIKGIEDITDSVTTATYKHELIVHDMRVVDNDAENPSIAEGDSVYVNALVKNKYGNDNFKVTYMLAAYDDNGKMLGVDVANAENYGFFADEENVIDFSSFKMPKGTTKAKVFAWSDMDAMIPVGNSSAITTPVTVHFFGASTTTRGYGESSYPQQGMSYDFERYMASGVRVTSYAIGGWSLRTLQELSQTKKPTNANAKYVYDPDTSLYAQLCADIKPGDFVLFGSTGSNEKWQTGFDNVVEDAEGNLIDGYTAKQSPEVYKARLDKTIKELKALGAIPIILSDLGQHTKEAYETGKLVSDYVGVQIEVAEANDIDFIDQRTLAYKEAKDNGYTYEQFAAKYLMTNAAKVWYQENDRLGSSFANNPTKLAEDDITHFTVEGALLFSRGIVAGLKMTDNPINFYFKDM